MPSRYSLPCLFAFLASLTAAPLRADSVLLIIADDLGRDSLAVFNDDPAASLPPTPIIDNLAAQGIAFNRMYAYSTCSPTRASIMTGRYEFRTGVVSPNLSDLQPNEFTLPEAIIATGIIGTRLAQFGKWHLGGDADAPNTIGGWPHYAGNLVGAVANYDQWRKTVNGDTTNRYSVYATTDVVNDAVEWISQQGNQDWFAWVAFNAPHTPFHKPDNSLHDYDDLSGTQIDINTNPRPYFEAMTQALDTEIGRLLQAVDLSDTTVIFIGDNGTPIQVVQPPFPQQHAKGSLYEGGINVPMIIAGAAVPDSLENTWSEEIIQSVDLYRTILDLLGADLTGLLPKELVFDSESFLPIITGASASHTRQIAYSAQPGGGDDLEFILADQDYKWIVRDDGNNEFYILAEGIAEENNRIDQLDTPAQSALSVFQSLAPEFENRPTIFRSYFNDSDAFVIELGWFANADLTLEHRGELNSGTWQPVDSFTVTDSGGSVLELSHTPTGVSGFYQVEAN